MKHLFVVNPAAGGKDRTAEIREKAAAALGASGNWEVYATRGPMDAAQYIAAAAENGGELRVYACGGDGTLNECVCGAVNRENVALTCIPIGTGNDFVKLFGGERARFLDLHALAKEETEVRALDVIDCNGRPALNICSVGIDARIGCDVHTYSGLPLLGGKRAYLTSTVVNVARGIARPLSVRCGTAEFHENLSLVCCCNGGYYGGGFHPVPEARPDDGVLDILVVKAVSWLQFFRLVAAYARGDYASLPKKITHLRERELHLESEAELTVNVDGETMLARSVDMKLLPGALRFFFPAGLGYFHERG